IRLSSAGGKEARYRTEVKADRRRCATELVRLANKTNKAPILAGVIVPGRADFKEVGESQAVDKLYDDFRVRPAWIIQQPLRGSALARRAWAVGVREPKG